MIDQHDEVARRCFIVTDCESHISGCIFIHHLILESGNERQVVDGVITTLNDLDTMLLEVAPSFTFTVMVAVPKALGRAGMSGCLNYWDSCMK